MPKPGEKAPDVSPIDEQLPPPERKRQPKEWRGPEQSAPQAGWRKIAGHYDVATDTFTHEPMIGPKRIEALSRAQGVKLVVAAKASADFQPAVAEQFALAWPQLFAAAIQGKPIRVPMSREAKKGFGAMRQIVNYIDIDREDGVTLPAEQACDVVSRYPQFLEIIEE